MTGAVAIGWAGFPLGWAFDLSAVIAPGGTLATVLQATFGFMPRMSWLQVIAWAGYIVVVGSFFIRGLRRRPSTHTTSPAPAVSPQPHLAGES